MSQRPTSKSSEGKDQGPHFFSQTMERYKRSVEQIMENNDAVTASNDLVSNYISEGRASKNAKVTDSDTSTDGGGASLEGHSEQLDSTTELAKKRLASRVSSRRTREREKLRMDHFRNAKVKLLEENKKLSDENQKIRSIILKIRSEKAVRDQSAAGVLSMFGSNSQAAATAPIFAPATAAAQPRQQPQTDLSALILNALTQNLKQQQAPVVPTQEQQLMALVGLVSNQPGLAHLVGHMHQTQQQQQAGLSQLVGQIHHALPSLSQLVGQLHQAQQQQPPGLAQLVGQLQQAQHQQQPQPMNLVAALQGNSNFGVAPNPNQSLQHNLLSILLGQGGTTTTSM